MRGYTLHCLPAYSQQRIGKQHQERKVCVAPGSKCLSLTRCDSHAVTHSASSHRQLALCRVTCSADVSMPRNDCLVEGSPEGHRHSKRLSAQSSRTNACCLGSKRSRSPFPDAEPVASPAARCAKQSPQSCRQGKENLAPKPPLAPRTLKPRKNLDVHPEKHSALRSRQSLSAQVDSSAAGKARRSTRLNSSQGDSAGTNTQPAKEQQTDSAAGTVSDSYGTATGRHSESRPLSGTCAIDAVPNAASSAAPGEGSTRPRRSCTLPQPPALPAPGPASAIMSVDGTMTNSDQVDSSERVAPIAQAHRQLPKAATTQQLRRRRKQHRTGAEAELQEVR